MTKDELRKMRNQTIKSLNDITGILGLDEMYIDELEKELEDAKKVQVVEHFEAYGQCRDSRRITELEQENAELIHENAKLVTVIDKSKSYGISPLNYLIIKNLDNQLTKAKEIIKELSKSLFLAKGIVRDLIDDTVDFKESKERATYCYEQENFDTYKKAEQFLRETDIDNAIQKANEGLNLDKIAEEIEQDIKEQNNS